MSEAVTRGFLVRLEAKHDKDAEVEAFLKSALPLARAEQGTTAWFAIKYGRHEYGIFDAFPDDAARDAHLNGEIAKALMAKAGELLASPPKIGKVEILASKLPKTGTIADGAVTKAVLLTFKAKEDKTATVIDFLKGAQPLAVAEGDTTAWFAIALESGELGVFDVFPDGHGRLAHLTGPIAQALVKNAGDLLGSIPDLTLIDVLSTKL